MADPDREVYVMIGDGSYLMMAQEIVTSVQEGHKLTIVLLNNHGYASIGALSEAVGSGGFGTKYRYRNPESGQLDGDKLPVDFAANAKSLGAHVIEPKDLTGLKKALQEAKLQTKTTVIVIETDREKRVPGYESWWDVAIAEVSEIDSVKSAYDIYRKAKEKERHYFLK